MTSVYQIGGRSALLGRIGEREIVQQFAKHGIDYHIGKSKDPSELNKFDWVYWSWERDSVEDYKRVFEAERKYKIVLFGQEQPQQLGYFRGLYKYADVTITSSPPYRSEVDYFLPFGIHDLHHDLTWEHERKEAILIGGSYRHSRGQLFDRLLREQPFDWPVYLFAPPLDHNMVERDRMREIVARSPRYAYKCADSMKSYPKQLLEHLMQHSLFVDFTTNSTNKLKFHEDLDTICAQESELLGGYCPERVLDSLWMGCYAFCFRDRAVEYVLKDQVGYYSSYDELVNNVNVVIRDKSHIEKAERSRVFVQRYTTSRVIAALANLYKTGKLEEL